MSRKWIAALLVAALAAQAGDAQVKKTSKRDKRVTIVNGRSKPLQRLYASNTSRNSWEEDILGDSVIPPGGRLTINFDDGSGVCQLDISGVFSDEVRVVKRGFDVCAGTSLMLKD